MTADETNRMKAWLGAQPEAWAKRMKRAPSDLGLAKWAGRVRVEGVSAYSPTKALERLAVLFERASAERESVFVRELDAAGRFADVLANDDGGILEFAAAELGLERVSYRAAVKLARELGA